MDTLPQDEQLARTAWAVAHLNDFSLITLEGPERIEFLQRLLSNDVRLAPGRGCRAFYLNVQGRPLAQLWVFETGSTTLLLTREGDIAYAELDKMHFGEKLKIARSPLALWLRVGPLRPDPAAPFSLSESPGEYRLGVPYLSVACDVIASQNRPDGPELSADTLDLLRLEGGSLSLAEAGEKTMFLEIAQASDYCETKGCYPGQEVVARTLHRGHINKKLHRMGGQVLPPPHTSLRSQGKDAGLWLTGKMGPNGEVRGLALVRRDFWQPGTQLESETGPVIVGEAP